MAEAKDYIIGIDTGGTFTDVVVMSPGGEVWTAKASTTPDDFSRGVMDALTEAARVVDVDRADLLKQAVLFKHGSTVATNALITRTGVKVGFITTRGFEDTTEIMRAIGRVDGLSEEEIRHATWVTKPEPLVPRERVMGVRERIDYRGEVVVPLSREDVMEAIRKLVDEEGCEAIAVSLLHAWANAKHEDDVRALVQEADPSRKVFWSFGSELAQVAGEYARANTAIINSFLGPNRGPLSRRPPDQVGRGRPGGAVPDHAGERRRGPPYPRHAGVEPPVRAGGGRHRVGLRGRPAGSSQRHHGGHGRHQLRRGPHYRGLLALRGGAHHRAFPHAAADHRHPVHRRRRRHHRPGRRRDRPAAGGTPERGRESRAGVLRRRRRGGHGHRLRPGAGDHRSRLLPRRAQVAEQGEGREGGGGEDRQAAGAQHRRSRRRGLRHRQQQDVRPHPAAGGAHRTPAGGIHHLRFRRRRTGSRGGLFRRARHQQDLHLPHVAGVLGFRRGLGGRHPHPGHHLPVHSPDPARRPERAARHHRERARRGHDRGGLQGRPGGIPPVLHHALPQADGRGRDPAVRGTA